MKNNINYYKHKTLWYYATYYEKKWAYLINCKDTEALRSKDELEQMWFEPIQSWLIDINDLVKLNGKMYSYWFRVWK